MDSRLIYERLTGTPAPTMAEWILSMISLIGIEMRWTFGMCSGSSRSDSALFPMMMRSMPAWDRHERCVQCMRHLFG